LKIFNSYGSKERLFEVMRRVNKLNEATLPVEEKNAIVNKFVEFVDGKLGLNGDVPEVEVTYDSNVAQDMKSFGKYTPETNELLIVAANRNLADVLRTLAHELIHHKQNKDGILHVDSSETGSEHENEANALAGVFMREFAKEHPMIFE